VDMDGSQRITAAVWVGLCGAGAPLAKRQGIVSPKYNPFQLI